jgi:hypothetical protein
LGRPFSIPSDGLKRLWRAKSSRSLIESGGAFRKHSFADLPDEQWLTGAGAGLRF